MERVVCANTLAVALREESKTSYTQNHRSTFDIEQVQMAMGVAKSKILKYKEQAQFLGEKMVTVDQMIEYFTKLYPVNTSEDRKQRSDMSRNAKTLLEVVETQPGADFAPGTWWNAFNSVTFASDPVS